MREFLVVVWWFFGPAAIYLALGLIGMALGPVIGIGLLCVVAYGLLSDGE
jgi:hypothetical protein